MDKKEAVIRSKESKKARDDKINENDKKRIKCFWTWPFGHVYFYKESSKTCLVCGLKKYYFV